MCLSRYDEAGVYVLVPHETNSSCGHQTSCISTPEMKCTYVDEGHFVSGDHTSLEFRWKFAQARKMFLCKSEREFSNAFGLSVVQHV